MLSVLLFSRIGTQRNVTPLFATQQEGLHTNRKNSAISNLAEINTCAENIATQRFKSDRSGDDKTRITTESNGHQKIIRTSKNHRTKVYQSVNHQKQLNHVRHYRINQFALHSDGTRLSFSYATSWRSRSFVFRQNERHRIPQTLGRRM